MPGNIYHFVIRETRAEAGEENNKNIPQEKNKHLDKNVNDIDFDKIWRTRYETKPQLTMNERIIKIYKALHNEFYFDLLY
jgi:hypothetical protein